MIFIYSICFWVPDRQTALHIFQVLASHRFAEEEFINGRPAIYGTAKIYHFDGTKFNLIREQESETE